MTRLGWSRATRLPDTPASEGDIDGSPNFFIDVPHSGNLTQLAEIAVIALRDVYGVRHPGLMEYCAFTADGTEIHVPWLHIKHAPST